MKDTLHEKINNLSRMSEKAVFIPYDRVISYIANNIEKSRSSDILSNSY